MQYKIIWDRDEGICQYCGFPGEQIDHIVPQIREKNNKSDNLVVSCQKCNIMAHGQVFPSFQAKREYILSRRRPRILREAGYR